MEAHGPRPSSPSSGQPPVAGSPAAAPVSRSPNSVPVASTPTAATGAPEASTTALEGNATVAEAAIAAGPGQLGLPPVPATSTSPGSVAPGVATTATTDTGSPDGDVSSPDADVSAVIGHVVQDTESPDGAGEIPGRGASAATPSGSPAIAHAAPKSTSDAVQIAVPTHGGSATEPAGSHGATAPADAVNVRGSTPLPTPHLTDQIPLASSDALRGAPSVQRVGEPAAPAAPSASSVAQQAKTALDVDGLSGSISRPLSDGNGAYTVTVALHPSELGHVQAVMSLDGNDLQVSLTAQTQAGHDALANATEALKNQLGRGGVNVNVTLRDPGSQSGGEERHRRPATSGAGSFITGDSATETPLPFGLVAGQIHLVL
jgi:flagellar hook-length control protein FliK